MRRQAIARNIMDGDSLRSEKGRCRLIPTVPDGKYWFNGVLTTYRCEIKIWFNQQTIAIYEKIGRTEGRILWNASIWKNWKYNQTHTICTRLICIGKDGLMLNIDGKITSKSSIFPKKWKRWHGRWKIHLDHPLREKWNWMNCQNHIKILPQQKSSISPSSAGRGRKGTIIGSVHWTGRHCSPYSKSANLEKSINCQDVAWVPQTKKKTRWPQKIRETHKRWLYSVSSYPLLMH